MHVRVLRQECCGNGECVQIAPAVFALDSKNKAVVLDVQAESDDVLREAAEACPCAAIIVEDDEGVQVFP